MSQDASEQYLAHIAPIFEDAAFVNHLGIVLVAAGPGWCETALTARETHLQQHGYVHAGVITTLADHTAGGAARAAVAQGSDVLTIEFKMNFLRAATSRTLVCTGRALRAGRTIVVAESEVFAVAGDDRDHGGTETRSHRDTEPGSRQLVAKCVSTLLVMPQRERIAPPSNQR